MKRISLRFRFKCALSAFLNPTINNYALKGEFPFTTENNSQPIKLTKALGIEAGDTISINDILFSVTGTAVYVKEY